STSSSVRATAFVGSVCTEPRCSTVSTIPVGGGSARSWAATAIWRARSMEIVVTLGSDRACVARLGARCGRAHGRGDSHAGPLLPRPGGGRGGRSGGGGGDRRRVARAAARVRRGRGRLARAPAPDRPRAPAHAARDPDRRGGARGLAGTRARAGRRL